MTITDEMVERAAKAHWEFEIPAYRCEPWGSDGLQPAKQRYRRIARAALEAARAGHSASLPPEEIAGLLQRAKERVAHLDDRAAYVSNMNRPRTDNAYGRDAGIIEELAAALQQQSRRIAELEALLQKEG